MDSPSLESVSVEAWGNSHTEGENDSGNPVASEGTKDSTIQGLPPTAPPGSLFPYLAHGNLYSHASLRHLSKGIPLPLAPDLPGKAFYLWLPLQSIPWLHKMTICDPNLL
jgi:hypothetical protein